MALRVSHALVILFLTTNWSSSRARAQIAAASTLAPAQALIDTGKVDDAETFLRQYATANPQSPDGHYLLGYVLFRQTKPKDSLSEYSEGRKYRPPGPLDLAVEGCDFFLIEDYSSAQERLMESLKLDSKNALAHYYLGRTNYNQKRFAQAVGNFTESLKLDPQDVNASNYLGLSLQETGKIEQAEAAFRSTVTLDKAAPLHIADPYLNLGTLLVDNNRPNDGLPFLARAIEVAPADYQTQKEIGKAFLLLHRFEEAQTVLEKAASIAPDNASVRYLLGQVYRNRGFTSKAEIENKRYSALTAEHSAPETPLAEARSLLAAGKLSEAERTIRTYISSNKTSADGHYLLGYILFKRQEPQESLSEYTEGAKYRTPVAADLEAVAGDYVLLKDYPDADKWFTKAVEWNSKDALGWYYLGRTKYNENRFDEAIAAFQQCLKLEPTNVKAEDNLGLSLEGLNRVDDATAAYRTAIAWQASLEVKDPGPFLNLGTLLSDSGGVEEALTNLQQAAQINSGDYRVHRQLGKLYSRMNQMTNALKELEKAVEIAPDNAPLHFMLAQVYRKQGLEQKAKREDDLYSSLTGSRSTPQ